MTTAAIVAVLLLAAVLLLVLLGSVQPPNPHDGQSSLDVTSEDEEAK